jgi:glutamate-1-semialdehyde 2,1-aminomutase
VAIEVGEGSRIVDLDGNEYVDVLNNYTTLVHGHAYPPVVDAIQQAAERGTVFPAPHAALAALAELLVARYPAVELVRFTNSGTEAAMLAARLARHATGRRAIVTFIGAYHGTAPDFADESPTTIRLPYNDGEAIRTALDDSVAAVFVEPFLGSGGVIPAEPEFLRAVQDSAQRMGAVFVLDEVQALRTAMAGAHSSLGLKPDLILMGKIIGGGLPVGALGGSTRLMGLTAADAPNALIHSGTFNGNVVTATAGVAAMTHLTEDRIERLNENAHWLSAEIEQAGRRMGLPVSVTRFGSIMQVHLTHHAPPAGSAGEASSFTAQLHLALLLEGVYAAPRGMLNLSTVTTQEDLSRVSDAYAGALARLEQARGAG